MKWIYYERALALTNLVGIRAMSLPKKKKKARNSFHRAFIVWMIFTHRIKDWMKRSHIKLWYLTDAEKKFKKKEREITTQREQRYLLENIFYKNIRENTTNTNLPRNWIVSVTVVKNRALESFIYFFFFPLFFSEIAEPRKVRVWFSVLGGRVSVVASAFRIAPFFPAVVFSTGQSISIMSIRLIILVSGLDCNSACQRQFFPASKSQLWAPPIRRN